MSQFSRGDFKEPLPFKVSIHDPMSVGDIKSSGFEVMPGYVTTFLITPTQIVSSESTMQLPPSKRICLFQHENNDLTLFKVYSQSNCMFECKLNMAYNKCHCIPWNYPHLNDSLNICDRFGKDCFEEYMSNSSMTKKCTCLPECATMKYTYSASSILFDAKALCKDDRYRGYWTSGKFGFPPKFIRRYEQVLYGKEIGEDTICIENTKKLAIVKFQITSQIITRIKKSMRVSFADTLSNIGKM